MDTSFSAVTAFPGDRLLCFSLLVCIKVALVCPWVILQPNLPAVYFCFLHCLPVHAPFYHLARWSVTIPGLLPRYQWEDHTVYSQKQVPVRCLQKHHVDSPLRQIGSSFLKPCNTYHIDFLSVQFPKQDVKGYKNQMLHVIWLHQYVTLSSNFCNDY